MAKSGGLVGERLLGMKRATHRPPNTSGLGRYLFVFFVIALGCIYAAPNLYQPDSALQIKGTSESVLIDQSVLELAISVLESNGISVKGAELTPTSVLIRVQSSEDQLRGRDVLVPALGETDDYIVALNLAPTTPGWLRGLGAKPMSLGLDLSGGIHFLLQVDMDKFIGDRMESNQEAIRDLLRQDRVRYEAMNLEGQQLVITFASEEARDAGETLVSKQFPDYRILSRDVDGKPALRLTMPEAKVRELEDFAISQNLQSLRNRVNELGVSEPLVQRLGRSRIVLDLPGLQDSARAKEIINKFANLEFRLVAGPQARPSQTESFVYEGVTRILEKANIVTGDQVTNAQQSYDQDTGLPQVSITLDNDGGRRMNEITKNNVGNSMAIIFKELKVRSRIVVEDGVEKTVNYTVEDNRVINIATIQSALGFRFRITGLELGEARDLALLLRAGALAAPMYIVEERTVGASLGEENIEKGQRSIAVGFGLVLVFMLFYYKGFGLAADLALTANLILMVAIMSVLGATLTMPGIAGVVLTVGMAVDANVLIFSRIKEEMQERSPQQAIQTGFDRALLTIMDANITTFFVAIILLSIGSGPVKGFAITLAVGICTSMFTAIMGTRALVNLMYGGRTLKKLII